MQQKTINLHLFFVIFLLVTSCKSSENYYYDNTKERAKSKPQQRYIQQPYYNQNQYYRPQNPPISRQYTNPYETYPYTPQHYDSDYYYRPPVRYNNVETQNNDSSIGRSSVDFKI